MTKHANRLMVALALLTAVLVGGAALAQPQHQGHSAAQTEEQREMHGDHASGQEGMAGMCMAMMRMAMMHGHEAAAMAEDHRHPGMMSGTMPCMDETMASMHERMGSMMGMMSGTAESFDPEGFDDPEAAFAAAGRLEEHARMMRDHLQRLEERIAALRDRAETLQEQP